MNTTKEVIKDKAEKLKATIDYLLWDLAFLVKNEQSEKTIAEMQKMIQSVKIGGGK